MDYHDRPELSSSQISAFIDDPIKWHHQHVVKDWPKDEPTAAMIFGTRVHKMIELGGPDNIPLVERPPGCDFRRAEWKSWKAEQEKAGKEIVDSVMEFRTIWAHLQANDYTRSWCRRPKSEKEFVISWKHHSGVLCRTMIDVFPGDVIVDWKTSTDTSPRSFQRSICDMNYDIRLAFYRRAAWFHTGNLLPVVAVAIGSSGGFQVQPYEIPSEWLDEAEEAMDATINRMWTFDIGQYLNSRPIVIAKPSWRFANSYQLEPEGVQKI